MTRFLEQRVQSTEDECEIRSLIEGELFVKERMPYSKILNFVGEYYWNKLRRAMPRSKVRPVVNAMVDEGVIRLFHHKGNHYVEHTKYGKKRFLKIGGSY